MQTAEKALPNKSEIRHLKQNKSVQALSFSIYINEKDKERAEIFLLLFGGCVGGKSWGTQGGGVPRSTRLLGFGVCMCVLCCFSNIDRRRLRLVRFYIEPHEHALADRTASAEKKGGGWGRRWRRAHDACVSPRPPLQFAPASHVTFPFSFSGVRRRQKGHSTRPTERPTHSRTHTTAAVDMGRFRNRR